MKFTMFRENRRAGIVKLPRTAFQARAARRDRARFIDNREPDEILFIKGLEQGSGLRLIPLHLRHQRIEPVEPFLGPEKADQLDLDRLPESG